MLLKTKDRHEKLGSESGMLLITKDIQVKTGMFMKRNGLLTGQTLDCIAQSSDMMRNMKFHILHFGLDVLAGRC